MSVVKDMAAYFISAPWQQRSHLVEDARLMGVAGRRAYDMATKHYFEHEDLDGVWPNKHVMDTGYRLPDWYRPDSNQVESIASGYPEPWGALDALYRSKHHTEHVCGLGFWADHTHYGVGYSAVDLCRIYVVITAPIEDGEPVEPADEHSIYLPLISRGVMG